ATDTPKVTDALGARTLAERIGFTPIGDLAARNPASFLVPGSYIAELDTNPFLENGLGARAKSARTRSKAVVFGLLESGVQP
ncbi:MAG TPA: hypothetical protein VK327_04545, partial [Candidatus Paceibacterota bacterium]|nr:hypothetical protein [Candidatus Paceibacterota bacterium]